MNTLYNVSDKYDDPHKSRQRFVDKIVSAISGDVDPNSHTFKP